MPIAKAIKSGSLRDTTAYVFRKREARMIGGTMLGTSADQLIDEFDQTKGLNNRVEKPCYHLIVSYSKEDEKLRELDDYTLADIATDHFAGLIALQDETRKRDEINPEDYRDKIEQIKEDEIYEYQFAIAVHEDVHHIHTHLVANRVNTISGQCLKKDHDWAKTEWLMRGIEKDYGIESNQNSWDIGKSAKTQRQFETEKVTGKGTIKQAVQEKIDTLVPSSADLPDLAGKLREDGIDVKFSRFGDKIGVSFALDGVALRGSDLGHNYSAPSLELRIEREREKREQIDYQQKEIASIHQKMDRESVQESEHKKSLNSKESRENQQLKGFDLER